MFTITAELRKSFISLSSTFLAATVCYRDEEGAKTEGHVYFHRTCSCCWYSLWIEVNHSILFILDVGKSCFADGTLLRLVQNVLDPVQQFVADGCHLARETGREISSAGFSYLNLNRTLISKASLISPHVYGMAMK